MRKFTDLQVWERSHRLVLEVYRLSRHFPIAERFGLTAQLRRAAMSVPANIAEGAKRESQRDFAHFLNIAEGSLAETQYLMVLGRDLGYANPVDLERLLEEVEQIMRMLASLRKKVARPK